MLQMRGLFYGIIIKKAIGFSVSDLNSTDPIAFFVMVIV